VVEYSTGAWEILWVGVDFPAGIGKYYPAIEMVIKGILRHIPAGKPPL
jgi:hypothetical protein